MKKALGLSKKIKEPAPQVSSSLEPRRGQEFKSLDEFEILETLGTGTFGRVRLVKHKSTGKYFALKALKKSEVIRLKQVEHIRSEKDILYRIDHALIVHLFATFVDETSLYMLMEYVAGGEIFSHLRERGRFSTDTSRFYAASIISAIQYLHSKDIIYRDLKPENLLLDYRGFLKVTDFGFAKVVTDRTWTLCGTPEYLAPEIIQSKGHGKSADWWALGILIYEMLAGYPPFYDENPFGIYQKILANKLEFPRHFDVHAKDLVKKLLQSDRTKRLGCLKNGAEDIKKHKWFKGHDWVALNQQGQQPPIVPNVKGEGDTQNFDKYPDSIDDPNSTKIDPEKAAELFKDFAPL